METLEVDLFVNRGALFEYDLLITDNGAPVDLDDYTAKLWVKETVESPVTLVELDDDQLSFIDSKMLIRIPATETTDYEFTAGVYDCKIFPPSASASNARRVMQGKFFVAPQITV